MLSFRLSRRGLSRAGEGGVITPTAEEAAGGLLLPRRMPKPKPRHLLERMRAALPGSSPVLSDSAYLPLPISQHSSALEQAEEAPLAVVQEGKRMKNSKSDARGELQPGYGQLDGDSDYERFVDKDGESSRAEEDDYMTPNDKGQSLEAKASVHTEDFQKVPKMLYQLVHKAKHSMSRIYHKDPQ